MKEMFADVYENLTDEAEAQRAELRGILETYPDEYDVSEFEGGIKGL